MNVFWVQLCFRVTRSVVLPIFFAQCEPRRHVWALQGDTGRLLDGWPLDLGGRFLANPLIARLRPSSQSLDVVSTRAVFHLRYGDHGIEVGLRACVSHCVLNYHARTLVTGELNYHTHIIKGRGGIMPHVIFQTSGLV